MSEVCQQVQLLRRGSSAMASVGLSMVEAELSRMEEGDSDDE